MQTNPIYPCMTTMNLSYAYGIETLSWWSATFYFSWCHLVQVQQSRSACTVFFLVLILLL